MIAAATTRFYALRTRAKALAPGVVLAGLVAMAAQFVAEHSQAPAMLMALLFGMAISFLSEQDSAVNAGVNFSAKAVLKIGIVLLGVLVSTEDVLALGWETVALVLCALVATMGFGIIAGRMLGLSGRFSVLTAGAVSICGASAALAISAVLPRDHFSERRLLLTVSGVTTLSTLAMVLYPPLLGRFGADEVLAGKVIGATIHDVAQVLGAGLSISTEAGEAATLVKVVRVMLLAPTVIVIGLYFRNHQSSIEGANRPPIIPFFVLGFVAMAGLNSMGFIPETVQAGVTTVSKAALLTAIAAVGIKTNLRDVMAVGPGPIALMVLQTVFIAAFATAGLVFLAR